MEYSDEEIWSFLLFSGYLKARVHKAEERKVWYELTTPNNEIAYLFETIVRTWVNRTSGSNRTNELLKALMAKDIHLFSVILQDFMMSVFSYYDLEKKELEKVYHAFLLGLLVNIQSSHEIKSNREAGYGRADVMIIPKDKSQPAFIIELKTIYTYHGETALEAVDSALKQIEDRQYAKELETQGITDITKLGIAFDGKRVEVKEG
jgi:hypothetical protein